MVKKKGERTPLDPPPPPNQPPALREGETLGGSVARRGVKGGGLGVLPQCWDGVEGCCVTTPLCRGGLWGSPPPHGAACAPLRDPFS